MRMQLRALCTVLAAALLAGVSGPAAAQAPGVASGDSPPAASATPKAGGASAPVVSPGGSAGKEDPHAGLPKALSGAVKELEALCRAEGGTANWTAQALVSEVNLSPDGRPDYLLDTHGMTCSASYTPWIGSDGFRYMIFVSTGPGRWTRAFDRPARGLEITTGPKPELVLLSHSAHCRRFNPERYQRCTQVYAWRRGRLVKLSEEWFTD